MISVITCTMRDACMKNVFENYERQQFEKKELIIYLTREDMDRSKWEEESSRFDNVSVFQVSERISLGACLNKAVQQARYDLIANFEDDDYYSPNYLSESNAVLIQSGADIIGKTTVYLYMPDRKMLTEFNSNNEHQFVNDQKRIGSQYLQGGTIFFKKEIINDVPFRDQVRELDRLFCQDCVAKGFKVYSAGKESFVYIRNDTDGNHTWKVPNDLIMNVSRLVAYTDDFRPYIATKDIEGENG
ncbi:glycosyltransferase [Alkalihalobacillus sp. AL-G]|uniref:glycosyltransferase n=1 Tax=Alkalihalobacillus sp. AL-G TaxID=2926399 RepID=UPI00272CAC83|nr:glycosyltransferase [Alkalihalobacillus sp. AL-G]WLD94945.1 glycosyltransferase [Alkalihalobacillus sp. AL-G]